MTPNANHVGAAPRSVRWHGAGRLRPPRRAHGEWDQWELRDARERLLGPASRARMSVDGSRLSLPVARKNPVAGPQRGVADSTH
jgi:hypothetical protein